MGAKGKPEKKTTAFPLREESPAVTPALPLVCSREGPQTVAQFRPDQGTIDIMVFRRVVFRPRYSTRIALVTSRPSLPAGAIPALVSPGINRGWEDGTIHVSEKMRT